MTNKQWTKEIKKLAKNLDSFLKKNPMNISGTILYLSDTEWYACASWDTAAIISRNLQRVDIVHVLRKLNHEVKMSKLVIK
jgi:hypothetical protein